MSRVLAVVVIMMGCGGGGQTPAGPVGSADDLRAKLPPDVAKKAPADDKATKREFPIDVHGVKAKVVWRTFDDGPNKYVLSTQWEVVTPSSSITLEPLGSLSPINTGTETAANETIIVRARWHDGSSFGELSVSVDGAGVGKLN